MYLRFYSTGVIDFLRGIVEPALGFVRAGVFYHLGLGKGRVRGGGGVRRRVRVGGKGRVRGG